MSADLYTVEERVEPGVLVFDVCAPGEVVARCERRGRAIEIAAALNWFEAETKPALESPPWDGQGHG